MAWTYNLKWSTGLLFDQLLREVRDRSRSSKIDCGAANPRVKDGLRQNKSSPIVWKKGSEGQACHG